MSIGNTLIAGPRGRDRPTHYSEELVEEFCGLIVDGMTVRIAPTEWWLSRYPEFRRDYEAAVLFRNQCWMDPSEAARDVNGQREQIIEHDPL